MTSGLIIISKRGPAGSPRWRRIAVLAAAVTLLAGLAAPAALAQKAKARSQEKAQASGEPPILEGQLRPRQILSLTPEWRKGFDEYKPDPASLEMLQSIAHALHQDLKVEVVVGTWCGDSRREVPRFMKMQRALRQDRLPVSFWGVDRSKHNPPEAVEGKNIEKVPTFIVYYKGQELGRITEKPEVSVEADLAEILSKAGKS